MTKALTPVQALKNDISKTKPQFKAALPNHISPDKFIRVVQTAISTNQDIAQASKQSLFAACTKAAQDGLLPDGREAAIVTFNSKNGKQASYMPMVAGILKKVRNSGELASISSQIVYQNDEFEFYVDDEGEHLKHKPLIFGDRGEQLGAYALAKTKDGALYVEFLTNKDIKAIEACSRGSNGPWSGPFRGEMIKKSAIRRLAKRLPMNTDIESTLRADDDLYELPEAKEEKTERVVDATAPNHLKDALGISEASEEVPTIIEEEVKPAKVVKKTKTVKNEATGEDVEVL